MVQQEPGNIPRARVESTGITRTYAKDIEAKNQHEKDWRERVNRTSHRTGHLPMPQRIVGNHRGLGGLPAGVCSPRALCPSTFEVMRLRVPMRAGPDGFPRWWVELGESS